MKGSVSVRTYLNCEGRKREYEEKEVVVVVEEEEKKKRKKKSAEYKPHAHSSIYKQNVCHLLKEFINLVVV